MSVRKAGTERDAVCPRAPIQKQAQLSLSRHSLLSSALCSSTLQHHTAQESSWPELGSKVTYVCKGEDGLERKGFCPVQNFIFFLRFYSEKFQTHSNSERII
jgi:hypothetical protein